VGVLNLLLAALVAQAAQPEVVVRVDDRAARRVVTPYVSVVYEDGTTISGIAVDDGLDPQDRFAGDDIWVLRMTLPRAGDALLLLTDTLPDEGTLPVAQRTVHLREHSSLLQLTVPPAAADVAAQAAQSLVDNESWPVDASALAEPDAPDTDQWGRIFVMQVLTAAVLVLLGLWRWATRRRGDADADRPPPPGRFRQRALDVAALAMAVGLLLAVWAPPLPWMVQDFLGTEYVDHYGTQWFYWFVEYHLRHGTNPAHTNLFFFPWGKDIYKHTGANVLDAYVAIPFRAIFGNVLGYNLFCLFFQAVSGWAFYLLARHFTADRVAAVFAAILYCLQPYLLLEMSEGRPTQGITLLPVLFLLCVFRAGERRGVAAPLAGGVLLALSGYQYWFYALFGGMAALAHGIWCFLFPAEGSGGRWRVLGRHAGMALVGLLLTLPVAAPMVAMTSGDSAEEVPGLLDTDLWSLSSAPPITKEGLRIGIYSWQPLRQATGFLVIDKDDNERFLAQNVAVPWVVAPLLLLWWWRPGRLRRGLGATMLVVLSLVALGPVLLIGDTALPNPPYIYLVKAVGFLRRLWWPSRAMCFIAMLTSIVLVVVVSDLRRRSATVQLLGLGAIVLWWGSDLRDIRVLPFPSWDATIPAGYRCLAEGGDEPIIELPYAWTQGHLYFQTLHERPIFGGMLEDNATFTPPEFTEFRKTNPMMKKLLGGNPIDDPFDWEQAASDEVRDLGFRYIVVQKDSWYNPQDDDGGGRLQVLLDSLEGAVGEAVYDDGRVAIYAPWGDPAPCDVENWPKDPAPIGPTEQLQEIREYDQAKQIFTHLFAAPADEDGEDDGDAQKSAGTGPANDRG
jgi:hypothetical protein